MPNNAERIVTALEALLVAKMEGATTVCEFWTRNLGQLNVTPPDDLLKLNEFIKYWRTRADAEGDDPGYVETKVFFT